MNHHLPKLYKTLSPGTEPWYVVQDGKLFRTAFHPEGWSDCPDYEIGDGNRLFRTGYHRLGKNLLPDYEFGNDRQVYRTDHHPDGFDDGPEFEIRD